MKTRLIQYLAVLFILTPFAVSAQTTDQSGLKVSVLRASSERRAVIIRFENHTAAPLRLLRPIDGSEWGWHMPIYSLTIADSDGKSLPMGGRCGNSGLYSNMKWPDDYQFQILPGDAYEMAVEICREIPVSASYKVTFEYQYDPTVKTRKQDDRIKYPGDLWVGSAKTEATAIEIAKQP
jgi:hypothetical protein